MVLAPFHVVFIRCVGAKLGHGRPRIEDQRSLSIIGELRRAKESPFEGILITMSEDKEGLIWSQQCLFVDGVIELLFVGLKAVAFKYFCLRSSYLFFWVCRSPTE